MNNIPSFQKLMLPVLKFYADDKEHTLSETIKFLLEFLDLTEEAKTAKVPSGQLVISNRASWAHTYLRGAGLLKSVGSGVNVITEDGHKVLESGITDINRPYLKRFKKFNDFISPRKNNQSKDELREIDSTPREQIHQAIEEQNSALRQEVLDRLRKVDPYYFEKIIADLLEIMGYGIAEVTQRSSDGGIDAIVNEDKLGLSKIYAQAKRYAESNRVNRKELQNFIGALDINAVTKGVFITTSSFYPQAKEELKWTQKNIVLIDGDQLAQLMIDYDLGVSTEETYKIKRIDSDYFEVE